MELRREFSTATLKDFKRAGVEVFDPFNLTLAALIIEGRPFGHFDDGSKNDPDVMGLTSRDTQVAILPESINTYIRDSNSLTLRQQEDLIKVDLEEVVKKQMGIGGVDMVVGDVATHAALAFAYFDRSGGIRLHGEDYRHDGKFRYVRADTLVDFGEWKKDDPDNPHVAAVGSFKEDGLKIGCWLVNCGNEAMWVMRLLVPAEE